MDMFRACRVNVSRVCLSFALFFLSAVAAREATGQVCQGHGTCTSNLQCDPGSFCSFEALTSGTEGCCEVAVSTGPTECQSDLDCPDQQVCVSIGSLGFTECRDDSPSDGGPEGVDITYMDSTGIPRLLINTHDSSAIIDALHQAISLRGGPQFAALSGCYGEAWTRYVEDDFLEDCLAECEDSGVCDCQREQWDGLRGAEDQQCARNAVNAPIIESGSCSGTVVYASPTEQETWVLTAAHCFYKGFEEVLREDLRLDPSRDHQIRLPSVEIVLETPNGRVFTRHQDSAVYLHPEWENDPDWYDTPDIALVRIQAFVSPTGANTLYQRPVYAGSAQLVSSAHQRNDVSGFASIGYGSTKEDRRLGRTVLRAKFATRADGSSNYVEIEGSDALAGMRPGDSGGPLMVLAPALAGHHPPSAQNYASEGIVIGVVSGPDVGRSFSTGSACACDYKFTSTRAQIPWLDRASGGRLLFVGDEWFRPTPFQPTRLSPALIVASVL